MNYGPSPHAAREPQDTSRSAAVWGVRQFVTIAAVLAVVAGLAPERGYVTDREVYQRAGQGYVVPDCSSIHCFRVLVAWVLESLPGPSLFKWKLYAVLCTAGAAVALARLSLVFGLSWRAASLAAWIVALGFGSLFTLFDPYTSDPLMYLLGPLMLSLLLQQRVALAGTLAAIGVLAKEFAAAPLWIFTAYAALARRWDLAARALAAANLALLVWLALQLGLMLGYNYSYGESFSSQLLAGAYLVRWVSELGAAQSLRALVADYGALFLLIPFGLRRASRELRLLVIAAIPAVLLFAYVQQPDRALWNFHFLFIPPAAVMVDRLPGALPWLFVASQALISIRFGGHPALDLLARFGVALSLLLALGAILVARRRPGMGAEPTADLALLP